MEICAWSAAPVEATFFGEAILRIANRNLQRHNGLQRLAGVVRARNGTAMADPPCFALRRRKLAAHRRLFESPKTRCLRLHPTMPNRTAPPIFVVGTAFLFIKSYTKPPFRFKVIWPCEGKPFLHHFFVLPHIIAVSAVVVHGEDNRCRRVKRVRAVISGLSVSTGS